MEDNNKELDYEVSIESYGSFSSYTQGQSLVDKNVVVSVRMSQEDRMRIVELVEEMEGGPLSDGINVLVIASEGFAKDGTGTIQQLTRVEITPYFPLHGENESFVYDAISNADWVALFGEILLAPKHRVDAVIVLVCESRMLGWVSPTLDKFSQVIECIFLEYFPHKLPQTIAYDIDNKVTYSMPYVSQTERKRNICEKEDIKPILENMHLRSTIDQLVKLTNKRAEQPIISYQGDEVVDDSVNVRVYLRRVKPLSTVQINQPKAILDAMPDLPRYDREHVRLLYLDTANRVVGIEEISVGTLNFSPVTMRELFKGAILANAARVIMVHNHPSAVGKGITPSDEDIEITRKVRKTSLIVGIPLIDHVIVGSDGHVYSLRANGYMSDNLDLPSIVSGLMDNQESGVSDSCSVALQAVRETLEKYCDYT